MDALDLQVPAAVQRGRCRGAVDVDVMAEDGCAGVLRDEPSTGDVMTPLPRDVHAAFGLDQPAVDRERSVGVQRQRGARRERHALLRQQPTSATVGPSAARERKGHLPRGVSPSPLQPGGLPAAPVASAPPRAGVMSGGVDPAAGAQRIDVVVAAVEPDAVAVHRHTPRGVQPIRAVTASKPGPRTKRPVTAPGTSRGSSAPAASAPLCTASRRLRPPEAVPAGVGTATCVEPAGSKRCSRQPALLPCAEGVAQRSAGTVLVEASVGVRARGA
jgi:hypothetical protein